MDLYQFNRRPLEQRAGIVMKHGTFLAIRHRSQYIISLYYINQFFAEMWYEPRRHEFVLVRGLRDRIALEPYLAMIKLSDII
ncbi:hypothetical protein DXT99_21770 [Pontibacter diazotrophicus]|uniref:Uncharacterized protein n=1 Tax=Pontibacter diazotrophicus TaxID=1400979 RepID=A0A3D8L6I5_9BACT|nr:hypothetical protein [Pontibacter diazotrophicus]RDV13008.1 hypothetical protein DXT99_21770 [Pontibacter diazotrophicus]